MPVLLVWSVLIGVDSSVAEGDVRSGFHNNCQLPIPLQLNTPFHHHSSNEASFSQGTAGSTGENVRQQE